MTRTFVTTFLFVALLPGQVVLAGPPDSLQAEFGKAQVGIRTPSEWVVVRGWKGNTPIADGYVRIEKGPQVEICWTITEPNGRMWTVTHKLHPWDTDPETRLPARRFLGERDSFHLVGNRLELRMVNMWSFGSDVPIGDLHLILGPAKK
jgi:hypothetical protein